MHHRIIDWLIVPPMKSHELVSALVERAGGALRVAKAMGSQSFQPTLFRVCSGLVLSPKRETAEKIAKHFGIPVDAIYDDKLATRIAAEVLDGQPSAPAVFAEVQLDNNPDLPSIRRVKFKLSAGGSGFGVEYLDDDDEPIVFRRAWFESRGLNPAKLFAVRVTNGSMQPGLWEDDTVVVNTADNAPKDGEVFAVNYEGELIIKRLVRDEGRWWLTSDNPDQRRFPRKACDEHVVLLGQIVHKQSERI
jgi:phage repressor protein C with HTH and peptisase S24 domain